MQVEDDVVDDLLQAFLRRVQLVKCRPGCLQLVLRGLGQPRGFRLEPLVDLGFAGQILINVTRFVAQVKHHTVSHAFVELVGVDVGAEDFQRGLLILLQQGRTSESDQGCSRHELADSFVELAGVGAVRLIDERNDVSLGLVVRREVIQQLPPVGVKVRVFASVVAILMDQRTHHAIV